MPAFSQYTDGAQLRIDTSCTHLNTAIVPYQPQHWHMTWHVPSALQHNNAAPLTHPPKQTTALRQTQSTTSGGAYCPRLKLNKPCTMRLTPGCSPFGGLGNVRLPEVPTSYRGKQNSTSVGDPRQHGCSWGHVIRDCLQGPIRSSAATDPTSCWTCGPPALQGPV